MAASMVDVTLSKLLSIKEVFSQLDPTKMAEILSESTGAVIYGGYVPSGIVRYYMTLVSKEVIESIESLISCRDIMIRGFTDDPDTLGQFFREVGQKELRFLVNSGTYFGFLLGILQMLQWMMFPLNWTLPVGGAVVGLATNWVALKLIFEPVEKIEILGGVVTIHGMFLMRQKEVSAECSKYLSQKVLTSHDIWRAILLGENSESLLKRIISSKVPLLTDATVRAIINSLGEQLIMPMPERSPHSALGEAGACNPSDPRVDLESQNRVPLHSYINRVCRIESLLVQRMERLTPQEFERVIHPVFEEDELTLIAAGACLELSPALCSGGSTCSSRGGEKPYRLLELQCTVDPPAGCLEGLISASFAAGELADL